MKAAKIRQADEEKLNEKIMCIHATSTEIITKPEKLELK